MSETLSPTPFVDQEQSVAEMVATIDQVTEALRDAPEMAPAAAPAVPAILSLRRRVATYAAALDRLERAITG